jgi:hypothetical protein
VWESAAFSGFFLASGLYCPQSESTLRPHAGNASRWVAAPKSKCKTIFDSQVSFCDWRRNSKPFLAVALFKQAVWVNIFQQAGFQVLGFFFWRRFLVGINSGLFCQVAKIGFKVFSLRFGLRWF